MVFLANEKSQERHYSIFLETGLYFTEISDSLQRTTYKDTLERKENYKQVL